VLGAQLDVAALQPIPRQLSHRPDGELDRLAAALPQLDDVVGPVPALDLALGQLPARGARRVRQHERLLGVHDLGTVEGNGGRAAGERDERRARRGVGAERLTQQLAPGLRCLEEVQAGDLVLVHVPPAPHREPHEVGHQLARRALRAAAALAATVVRAPLVEPPPLRLRQVGLRSLARSDGLAAAASAATALVCPLVRRVGPGGLAECLFQLRLLDHAPALLLLLLLLLVLVVLLLLVLLLVVLLVVVLVLRHRRRHRRRQVRLVRL